MDKIDMVIENKIMAIIPVYVENKGNSTKVITAGADITLIYKSIKTVLKIIANYFMTDMRVGKKYYGNLIGATNVVPVVFNNHNIFVPLKTRKPISKNDGSFGYFNLDYIERVEKKNGEIYIILKNDIKVKTILKLKSVKKHIREGKIIKNVCTSSPDSLSYSREGFYCDFNAPATKGDIAILRNEILSLQREYQK
ncbi:hypothetical protein [Dethiothermospora halolimnae]|uniref:hypothetical protein n=1 Tax=Dethiothermospora halolimnae TaxID=3114390 RepID=UPI003CCC26A1